MDDGTLVTNSLEDTIVLLDLVDQFSKWSGIYLNISKCKISVVIHELHAIHRKRKRDDAMRAVSHTSILRIASFASLPKTNPSQGGI